MTPISTRVSGHNGASLPPRLGGGDGGRNHGDGDGMPDFIPESAPNYAEVLRRARMGLAIVMTPIVMLFISFTTVYIIRRDFVSFDANAGTYLRTWVPVQLPWMVLLANTILLIASSFTVDLARRDVKREAALAPVRSMPGISLGDDLSFPWLAVTTVLGLAFLAGQLVVWSELSHAGFHLIGGTSSSFIYILTAMHGLHLAGGILALMFCSVAALRHRAVESRRIVVDITTWYWHCMSVLWIYILLLFWFAAK